MMIKFGLGRTRELLDGKGSAKLWSVRLFGMNRWPGDRRKKYEELQAGRPAKNNL